MAQIGVLTFSFTKDNYGQILQYLATQEYLKQKGHKAILIEPTGWQDRQKSKFERRLVKIIKEAKRLVFPKTNIANTSMSPSTEEVLTEEERQKRIVFRQWSETTDRKEQEHPRHFEEFREKYFNRQFGTYNDILASGYKAFCVGSDQTWSGAGYHMMLGWVPKKIKRFSIASSVGHRVYTDNEVAGFKNYLKRFNFITVREDSGLELCRRCGYKSAKKILDPTFLLNANDYLPYAEKHVSGSIPYVFIYLLGGDISISLTEIVAFCESKGYEIRYIESQGRDEHRECIEASVEQWLGLIMDSSYVVTNSFHGMALSVLFHKPFLVFPLVGIMKDMNGRINDLAQTLQLEERIYSGDMNTLFQPINWYKPDSYINNNRKKVDKLINSLNL